MQNEIEQKITEGCNYLREIKADITVDRVLDYCGVSDPSSNLVLSCNWPLIREIVAKIEYERRNN